MADHLSVDLPGVPESVLVALREQARTTVLQQKDVEVREEQKDTGS